MRKTSPLLKRNKELFREIDLLKARLYPKEEIPPRTIIEQEMANKTINISNDPKVNIAAQKFLNSLGAFGPVPPPSNQPFVPIQPVPPPQQTPVELDQQFFIGQQALEPSNPYGAPPVQQPPMMHDPGLQPLGPPNVQPNFQPNWIMEQPQPQPQPPPPHPDQINYFNPNSEFSADPNNYQPGICPPALGPPLGPPSAGPPMEYMANPISMMPQQEPQFVPSIGQQLRLDHEMSPIAAAKMEHDEELFAKVICLVFIFYFI